MTFDVAETATGHDRAALIDKFGAAGRHRHRAGVRKIDERAIKAHADLRFRSEYDYALFEYYRSAKVIAFLERAGVAVRGRVLDAGCGGGGMPLSLAEEAGAGRRHRPDRPVRRRRRAARPRARHAQPALRARRRHGAAVSRPDRSTWCCRTPSSSTSPTRRCTCANARACWRRAADVYLSTAPYLSFAGAHLPRLKVPVPLHLMLGRRDRVRDVPLAGAARAVDAAGAGARELVHQGGAPRRGQARRPAREGPRHAAARADRRRRPARRPRGAARRRRRCAGCRRRRRAGCATAR